MYRFTPILIPTIIPTKLNLLRVGDTFLSVKKWILFYIHLLISRFPEYGGFLKWGYPQSSSIFNGILHIHHAFGGTPICGTEQPLPGLGLVDSRDGSLALWWRGYHFSALPPT